MARTVYFGTLMNAVGRCPAGGAALARNGDQPSGETASRTEAALLTAALVDQAGTTVAVAFAAARLATE